jgi:uncharacterized protein (TIGR03085 family)
MTRLVPGERHALVTTLRATPPDAPTLCEGWTAVDLAAHIVVRERRPDADLSLLLRADVLRRWTDRVRDRARDRSTYPELVRRVGTASWPLRVLPFVDEAVNLVELVVHHEDVRRGRPGWEPRDLDPALSDAVWSRLRRFAPLGFRRVRDLPIRLVAPQGRDLRIHRGSGGPGVTIRGEPVELLLYAYGRGRASRVEVTGDPAGVGRLRALEAG